MLRNIEDIVNIILTEHNLAKINSLEKLEVTKAATSPIVQNGVIRGKIVPLSDILPSVGSSIQTSKPSEDQRKTYLKKKLQGLFKMLQEK